MQEEQAEVVPAKVQPGEADAAIVGTTGVTAEVTGDVTLVEIPASVDVVATYLVVPVAGGDEALAAALIADLLGPDGRATRESFGSGPAPTV